MDGSAAVEVVRIDDLDVRVQVSERRRHVRLTVERDAAVTATVPPGTGRAELVKLVRSRRRWLYGKLAERQALGEARPERQYVSGEGFPYLGRSHRLLIVPEGPADVRLLRGRLELGRHCLDDPVRALIGWYTRRGTDWLPDRLRPWAERMDTACGEVRVLPLGFRWGSCSLRGHLNIHWATMQLPPDLIDYVLVHELAHLQVPDHSERFWRRVERTLPDYTARRERLKRLGHDLWLPSESGGSDITSPRRG
ncbi:M48 family metallopeptidase [Actinomadura barringtoniae]|uniref:M48 family metallopeptidase n=1 Tax=Actinomadura barringtoniae TaxID=1427535 RepID=A0A939T2T4_9ACTN|nr:SprT family zinc-dependent metalloprotease [Actinomadura barringtoniae]MBO2447098.1 M48 family metallopeptidase [Actinomadura barringtoniae]